ncbi:hypothetical protein B0A52_04378 [Exophiala mesophila]|uniref:D-xylose reductase [NAD(P)H] n=1 Tax=Exophiala mesophila TaxID=212818 RepID=A0A438N8S7_EXOME|nr:hypothetical protein B0A52_04378 [Exophiala mesophila]
MSSSELQVVFGGGPFGNYEPYTTTEGIQRAFSILKKHGVTRIDTAQIYGQSEAVLGANHAGDSFTLDTKWAAGFQPGSAKHDNIVASAKESIRKLGVKQVDIFYLHSPDVDTPDEETLAGIQEVYKLGLFKRLGLSNYTAAHVEKMYNLAKEKGYVVPSVYQGNYNPVARRQDTELFPTLRKLNISFFAYSPLAGGFLTKTAQQIKDGAGRFGDALNGLYKTLYAKPSYIKALEKWEQIAKQEGISRAELAYRWVVYHSQLNKDLGDAIIFGARDFDQLEETLVSVRKGKLSEAALKGIDEVWEEIKHEAPLDNYHK